jgi:toxin ParE1/3/4
VIDHYFAEAGEKAASGFVDALTAAYRLLAEHPASGSPRYAVELGLPGLRSRMLGRYPYLIFYVETEQRIEVWRVLHASRDVPRSLQDNA